MGLLRCPDCGKNVSDTLSACPHCGRVLTDADRAAPRGGSRATWITLVILGALTAGVWFGTAGMRTASRCEEYHTQMAIDRLSRLTPNGTPKMTGKQVEWYYQHCPGARS